jgi:DHA2 family multidrug resistance protein-like MFS transporter
MQTDCATPAPASTAAATATTVGERRRWIGLGLLTLPALLVSVDLTVLHLAVPHLSADLAPSGTELLWILDIHTFLVAGSLITMGAVGDRIGRRRLLLAGATVFGLASLAAAFAASPGMLIAARALVGLSAATLMPSALALASSLSPTPRHRTLAVGTVMASFAAGMAAGPLIGGWLLQRHWWGAGFLLAAPLAALLVAAGPTLLPDRRDRRAPRPDPVSAPLSLAALVAVVAAVKLLANHGAGWLPAVLVVGGLALAVVFIRRQQTLTDPLIDLSLFDDRRFGCAVAFLVCEYFAQSGIYPYLVQSLQLVAGLPPATADAAGDTLGGAAAVAAQLDPQVGAKLLESARRAFVQGMQLCAAVTAVLLTAVAMVTPVLLARTSRPTPIPTHGEQGCGAG